MRKKSKLQFGNGRGLKGSFTVELSFLMPMILFLIMACIFAIFFYHDKNILTGAAYEASVVGSTMSREIEGIDEEKIRALARERIQGKCIFLHSPNIDVNVEDEEVQVTITASAKHMRSSVTESAAVTKPEKYIRDLRKIQNATQ